MNGNRLLLFFKRKIFKKINDRINLSKSDMKQKFTPLLLTVITATGLLIGAGCTAGKKATSTYFSDFPASTSPQEVGKKIALRYLSVSYQNFNRPTPPRAITYPETCTWYGALTFAKLTNDKKLVEQLGRTF